MKEVNEQPIGGGRTGFSLESESSNDELGIGGFGKAQLSAPTHRQRLADLVC